MSSDTREEEALLRQRVVVLEGEITDDVANVVIAKLLFLDHEDGTTPTHLRMRSQGGHISSALAIRDTMDHLLSPVHVHAIGDVGGVSCVLLAHGLRGERSAVLGIRITLSTVQPSKSVVSLDALERTEGLLADMLEADTGQPRETILADMRSGRAFTSDEARAYGLIDQVRG